MSDAVSSEDFQAILAQVREWVRTRVVPREREIADADAIPADLRSRRRSWACSATRSRRSGAASAST